MKITLFLFSFIGCSIVLILVLLFLSKKSYADSLSLITNLTNPYMSANGTQLYMNGKPFQFTGVNAFNLATDPGVNAGCGAPEEDLDGFFSRLRPNSVVRIWAFQGSMAINVTTKQIDWTGLDRVVNAAQKDGIKL